MSKSSTTKRDLLLKLASLDEQIQNIAKKQLDEIQNNTKKQSGAPILDEIQNIPKKHCGVPILDEIQNSTKKYCGGPSTDIANFSVVDQVQFCNTRDENINPKSFIGPLEPGTPAQIKHTIRLEVMLEKLEIENQKLCQELEETIVRTELQQRLLQEQQKQIEERDKLLETITDMEKKYAKLKKKYTDRELHVKAMQERLEEQAKNLEKKKFHYQINDAVEKFW